MKNLLLLYIAILFLFSCATQKITRLDYPHPFEFELIDTAVGSKSELYLKAWEWMARTFVNSKAVIEVQDKEAGKLIGKSVVKTGYGDVYFILAIDCKDGKYRAKIDGFLHEPYTFSSPYSPPTTLNYGNLQEDIIYYKSPNGGGRFEDKKYTSVKNASMLTAKNHLSTLKIEMHKVKKDF